MWSSTNQRIKALMSARQREKDRLTRPIHVRRADLTLSFRTNDDFLVEIPARALLNDFTPTGFSVYAVEHLTPNAELTVVIDHPKHFRLTGKVVWCQYQPSSTHVLTANSQKYPYRVGLAFIWKDAALEEEFKKFCMELLDLYVNKKGLFIEENFVSSTGPVEATSATTGAADPHDVPAPKESDEGGAPTDDQVAAQAAAAAVNADPALASAPAPNVESASSVLDALKDFDPTISSDEKKAA